MQIPPMRPSFTIEFPLDLNATIDRLARLVDDRDYPIDGRIAGNHLLLVIPPSRRHFWSPWLHLEVHEHGTGAVVKGRFSPNPSVWTGFMLGYIALATLVLFAVIFGFSQWMLNKPPGALTLAPIPIGIGVLMYWASLVGQRIAHEQMNELYDASMRAITGDMIDDEGYAPAGVAS
ncbi:MAG: hypothetical protein JJ916_05890 [Phycisphaerales bacterium]|nr:hypothetical protein [Phycisphaerales bacterium]